MWVASTSQYPRPALAQPLLDKLASQTAETATLGVLQLDDVLVIGVAPGPQELAVNVMVGTRYEPHCTAMGKVLLASLPSGVRQRVVQANRAGRSDPQDDSRRSFIRELDEVATRGLALEEDEREVGISQPGRPGPGSYGRGRRGSGADCTQLPCSEH